MDTSFFPSSKEVEMQPKVSIVIPCYNKEKYIGKMFDSILAQKWDAIELILVNDGSTDGTREVISKYESKFHKRGFEVVVVDQENRGLPGAVYEGLKRISGEYVCQVDADDELDPEYISIMAGWLQNNPDYDWVVCDILYIYEDGREEHYSFLNPMYPEELLLSNYTRSFLLGKVLNTVHEYMARTDYVKRSGVIKNYCTERYRTQEQQWVIPLAVTEGKLKYIPQPLYRYIQNVDMISLRKTPEDFQLYTEDYFSVGSKTVELLNIPDLFKKELCALSSIRYYELSTDNALWRNSPDEAQEYFNSLVNVLDASDLGKGLDAKTRNRSRGISAVFTGYITDQLIGHVPKRKAVNPNGRVIAYAAYGKAAMGARDMLLESDIRPYIFWDKSACIGDTIDGISIETPDFESLSSDDTVLLLLKSSAIIRTVLKQVKASGVRCNIWFLNDVRDYLVRNQDGGLNGLRHNSQVLQ
jgi:glycosyltransferase involved in cell wall biosynthesis